MSKPQPKRIPSDKCAVSVDGDVYYPHEGEWVELIARETVGELRMRIQMSMLGSKLDAIHGEPDEVVAYSGIMDQHYDGILRHLAQRVFAWNWTDDRGQALPPPVGPDGAPLGMMDLRAEELYWLMNATYPREVETELKNA